jgi:hypothetical protein
VRSKAVLRTYYRPDIEFLLGILAALIGAGGAFGGAWLSRRHERQLEQDRWWHERQDTAEDARAAAIGELTRHLASVLQTISWFTADASIRAPLFGEQTILRYDAEISGEISSTTEALISVAYRDAVAFRTLERLVNEAYVLDWKVASQAAMHWADPEQTRVHISSMRDEANALAEALPRRIVDVLHRAGGTQRAVLESEGSMTPPR